MSKRVNKILTQVIKTCLIIFVIGSPFSISLAQIGLVSAIFFWLISLAINRLKNFRRTIIDIPIIIYLIGQLITSIFCEYSKNAFANYQGEWQILMVYMIGSIDRDFYKKLLNILFIMCIIISIYGFYQHFTGWDLWRQKYISTRVGGFAAITGGFGLHLTFGGYFMMIALLALSYFVKYKKYRFFYIIGTMFIVLATIGSYAKTAWVGFVCGVIFMAFFIYRKNLKRLVLFLILIIAIIFLSIWFIEPLKNRVFVQTYSWKHRLAIWKSSLFIIREHPILGIGNGNFKRYSEKYMKDSGFPAEGHPHNDYLNIYLTAGLIGFIGYMLMWIIILRKGIKYVLEEREDKPLMIGLLSALVAFMIAGLGQNYFTDSENSMLMWFFIAGVNLLLKNEKN